MSSLPAEAVSPHRWLLVLSFYILLLLQSAFQ